MDEAITVWPAERDYMVLISARDQLRAGNRSEPTHLEWYTGKWLLLTDADADGYALARLVELPVQP